VLELLHATPPEWAERALARPLELLSDHAHCELRAAASAQGIITHNASLPRLVDRLGALAIEEMQHFRRVVALLRELGGELEPRGANPYAEGLISGSLATRGSVLLDRLLIAGLIELRSHERFSLLARAATEPRVRALYAELLPSEEGHGRLFWALARDGFGAERLAARARELAELEASVVRALPFAPRVHSGLADAPRPAPAHSSPRYPRPRRSSAASAES